MKRIMLFLLLVGFIINAFADKSHVTQKAIKDSIQHYLSLANQYEQINLFQAEKYVDRALQYAHPTHQDTVIANVLLQKANIYRFRGRLSEAMVLIDSVKTIFGKYGASPKLTYATLIKGILLIDSGVAQDAAQELFYVVNHVTPDDSLKCAMAYINLGLLHYYQILEGKPEKTNQYLLNAIRLFKKSPYLNFQAIGLNYEAVWNILYGDKNKAFQLVREAIEINTRNNQNVNLGVNYHNLGFFYVEAKDYAKAEEYLNYTIDLCKKTGTTLTLAKTIQELSKVYVATEQFDRAIELLENLRVMCEENKYRSIGAYVSATLSKLYFYKQDYKKSAEYLWQYSIEKDSLSRNLNITEQRIQYEKSSQEQQEKLQDTITRNRTQFVIFITILLCFVAILLLLFRNLNNKRKWLKHIEEKNMVITTQAEEVQKMLVSLDIANQSKEKFLSVIAHDLINPFNTIIGLSELILKTELDKSKQEKFILKINEASKDAYKLLEQLLLWSRAQSDKLTVTMQDLDLNLLVKSIIQLYQPTAEAKGINIIEEIQPKVVVYSDENFLSTIIRNLLSNAIKFTHLGGFVTVRCLKSNDGKVHLMIKDTGIGISPEKIKKLVLNQKLISEVGTNKESGTGLGLAICYEFAHKINVEIQVQSEQDRGSCFTLILPVSESL